MGLYKISEEFTLFPWGPSRPESKALSSPQTGCRAEGQAWGPELVLNCFQDLHHLP